MPVSGTHEQPRARRGRATAAASDSVPAMRGHAPSGVDRVEDRVLARARAPHDREAARFERVGQCAPALRRPQLERRAGADVQHRIVAAEPRSAVAPAAPARPRVRYGAGGGPGTSSAAVSPNAVGVAEYGTSSSTGQFLCAGRSPASPTIQRAPSARASHDQRLSAGRIARSKRGARSSEAERAEVARIERVRDHAVGPPCVQRRVRRASTVITISASGYCARSFASSARHHQRVAEQQVMQDEDAPRRRRPPARASPAQRSPARRWRSASARGYPPSAASCASCRRLSSRITSDSTCSASAGVVGVRVDHRLRARARRSGRR